MQLEIVTLLFLGGLAIVQDAEAVGKVLDIDNQLPELVGKHPDKSWLIKFYAPWCYHCQQLHPIYNNVAERIYPLHDNLIVGRVDCTKSSPVCEKYGVDSYPTIMHISSDSNIKYMGERSEASIVAFAERLQGPDINRAYDCEHLKEMTKQHGLVVLSNINNSSDEVRQQFEALAREHKSDFWFYHHVGTCKNYLPQEGLYLLKRHLDKPIKFNKPTTGEREADDKPDVLKRAIVRWLEREATPVYGRITYKNFERTLGANKLMAIAVLDEYKPASQFVPSSLKFHQIFEKLARKYAARAPEMIFGWCSDLELIEFVTIGSVSTPNVILMQSNFSYYLLVDSARPGEVQAKMEDVLRESKVESVINAARDGKIQFVGGNNHFYVIMRHIMSIINKFFTMYRANPLLVLLIFGFPGLMMAFVVYTTCFYEGHQGDDQDLDDEVNGANGDEERQHLLSNGHMKQD